MQNIQLRISFVFYRLAKILEIESTAKLPDMTVPNVNATNLNKFAGSRKLRITFSNFEDGAGILHFEANLN